MPYYTVLVILITLSAAFAYLNHRFLKLPFVIGLFLLSTLLSLGVLLTKYWNPNDYASVKQWVDQTNISRFVLEIMLGFLLFAGALHTDWPQIKKQVKTVGLLAVGGVLLSTVIIAGLMWCFCGWFGIQLDFIYCLLFGALISPTDPIAVLGILTKANVPKKIEATIVGESLFNDGVGVVVFIALLETLRSQSGFDFGRFGLLFLQEAVGGLAFGFALGYALHVLLRSINHYETEVLLTLAFVMGGFALCGLFHLSGALAMVVMGLLVGNFKTNEAMTDVTQAYVHKFWELLDVILNALLFIIMAFVLMVLEFRMAYVWIGLLCIVAGLVARAAVVLLPVWLFPKWINLTFKESKVVVWGGLRGGLSLALVLSIPENPHKGLLVMVTYLCVVFSILVQGLSIGKLAKKWVG
ncbi:MAG: sodium:proton antiporter [Bacteroidetes bacterium]|nr:MAG: sodium:proton antiporter [Bacteroidota bacterium]